MSTKSNYIRDLINAKTAISVTNQSEDADYLTYFTSNSIVVGRVGDINPVKIESYDTLDEALEKHPQPVGVMDLATGLFNFQNSKEKIDEDQSIYLADAQILTAQNIIIHVSEFVIFSDQIIGVVAAKIDLSKIQKDNLVKIV